MRVWAGRLRTARPLIFAQVDLTVASQVREGSLTVEAAGERLGGGRGHLDLATCSDLADVGAAAAQDCSEARLRGVSRLSPTAACGQQLGTRPLSSARVGRDVEAVESFQTLHHQRRRLRSRCDVPGRRT